MRFILKSILRVFAALMAFGVTAGIVGLIGAIMVFSYYDEGLPSFEKLASYEPPVVTRLYAANGKLLAEYATEKRIFVPLKAMPVLVRNAFIAAEDKNFYTHKGVDIFGIARAIRENVQNYGSGRSMVGGSTITQQVVKNFLLSNEKSFERKIKEAILAYRITKVYSKDKILELYLNEIYLGNGSYGVAAAALNYFNKSLDELTVEEAAMLAAMPKAPSSYDPRFNPSRALERRNYVIGRMFDDGYLSEFEAQRAAQMPIELEKRAKNEVAKADFFAEEVRRDLAAMYGSDALYEGGLTVKTTVDESLQQIADSTLRATLTDYDRRYGYRGPLMQLGSADNWEMNLPKATEGLELPLYDDEQLAIVIRSEKSKATIGLPSGQQGTIPLSELKWAREDLKGTRVGREVTSASDVLKAGDIVIVQPVSGAEGQYALHQVPEINGALVAMEPNTGKVLAMSGGYSYIKTEFNRATQALRQPGSAFKPFVYLAALENGFTPSTIVVDEPIEIYQGPGKPMWRPKNYEGSYLGPTTLRVGLEKSRNTMTVRLAQMLGIGRIINVAKRFGIYEGDVPANYSMTLGAKETTLLKMVNAYSMIANGGRKVNAALIERIDNRHGEIIFRRDNRQCVGCKVGGAELGDQFTPPKIDDDRPVVLDRRIAYQLTSLLEGVALRGTAARAYSELQRPIAGKTGTTNDSRDAWFIGFSPDLAVGVYIGFDQPRTLGSKETGGRVALPGFIGFMKSALEDVPARPFRSPPGIKVVQVDRATGLPPYPGEQSGKIISEVFVVGGSIYKPPLPEDAADERDMAMDPGIYDDSADTYDPYADWEDANYYMSPQRAQERSNQVRTNTLGTIYPGPNRFYDDDEPTDGFNVNEGTGNRPVDPYRRRAPEQQNPSDVPDYGTGGLY